MTESFCNVALPVPLRTTFTYSIPESLRAEVLPGSRVLVPFRKKSLVGVVIEMTATIPEGTKIRDVQRTIDLIPALTPKLLELGQWIASYYLAPIGEVFRAMLPPGHRNFHQAPDHADGGRARTRGKAQSRNHSQRPRWRRSRISTEGPREKRPASSRPGRQARHYS